MREIFEKIYEGNMWGGSESVSGPGSCLQETKVLIGKLEKLFSRFNINTVLDAPCGDFNWMKHVNMKNIKQYLGVDIVPELIEQNKQKFGNAQRNFLTLDISREPLPQVDLIICRDCLVHFSMEDIWRALKNFSRSSSRFILTTTFTEHFINNDIKTGDWRFLNLEKEPFNFPKPLYIIKEHPVWDKCMALWYLDNLRDLLK